MLAGSLRATRAVALLAALGVLLILAVPTESSAAASCNAIKNPYAGTRYEGVDLRRIKASHVNCKKARRVVRGAHRKALGITPPADGIRLFKWHGWRVRGDLRRSTDHYSARRNGATVRWVF